MNKNRKRAISRGKFERCSKRAVRGMRVNAFTDCPKDSLNMVAAFVDSGFIYWWTYVHGAGKQYFRKSLVEALS